MKRYILTGAPGAGKTTLIRRLESLGHAVVREAATDVVAAMESEGVAEHWKDGGFIARITGLQRARRLAPCEAPVQFHDRSAVCVLALARFLGLAVPPLLTEELAAIADERIFERQVFFVRNIGFVEPTTVRRISFEDSLAFEALHEEVYRELGYELIEVPAEPVQARLARVLSIAVGDGRIGVD